MALAFERSGSGEPVVLIHGLGSRGGAWGPAAEIVAREREVIALDLPGFGVSEPDGTEPSVAGLADRVERFFDEERLERPDVAGNSMGGAIALELGRRGAVRSVTAFSPIGFWGTPGRLWGRALLTAGVEVGRRAPKEGVPEAIRVATSRPALFLFSTGKPWQLPREEVLAIADEGTAAPSFDAAVELTRGYEFGDPGLLPELPVTVAWGTRDVLLTYATQSRRARRLLPFARHVALPGCGHVPFFDDPERCAAVILQTSGG
jgi:pimeloyl-ACP methyl ester carboxylesterase